MSDYESLKGHLYHHGVRWALDQMCKREDARTIREALARTPTSRLVKALAAAMAKER